MMKSENNELNIVQIAPPQNVGQGDYFYRVESPGRALAELPQVKSVISLTTVSRNKEALCRDADILIINHTCDADLIPVLIERRRKRLATIFEIGDNIFDIQEYNPTYQFWKRTDNRNIFKRLIKLSHAAQTNNRELASVFRDYNGTHLIFPNHILFMPEYKTVPRDPDIIRIGWAGSYGHLDDLRELAPVLIEYFRTRNNIRFLMMANDDLLALFSELDSSKKEFYKAGSLHDYYKFLQRLDLGIAPLKDNPYNRCRSDVKFVEYAAHGVVPILQELPPYNGEYIPGGCRYLFKYPWQLPEILDRFVDYPEFMREISRNAYKYVSQYRDEKKNASQRLEAYLEISQKISAGRGNQKTFSSFQGYFPYRESDFEKSLYNGLVYFSSGEDPGKAVEMFQNAEQLEPTSYLPPLFASQCVNESETLLKEAIHRNSRSIKARLLLAEGLREKGEYKEALSVLREIIQIDEGFTYPYLMSADILRSLNKNEKAEELIRIAKEKETSLPEETDRKSGSIKRSKKTNAIFLIMPVGYNFGWGICGKYLALELANLCDLHFVTDSISPEAAGSELEYIHLQNLKRVDLSELQKLSGEQLQNLPGIQAIQGKNMLPVKGNFPFGKRIGYTFFEENIMFPEEIENGRRNFDLIVAGSTWNEEVLKKHGLDNTATVIQGVDHAIFNPFENEKKLFRNYFVIFSGGKFEFRKGQDLVMAAFKHLHQKYKDVLLVTSWFNHWEASLATMQASPYISFEKKSADYQEFVRNLLVKNGIDPGKVINLPPKPNVAMAQVYKNSDIGLFPNRCEGGTNLVLMEYMATGKPVIASFSTGHRDILTKDNSIMIKEMRKISFSRNNQIVAEWDDPSLEEIIEKLEWAYLNSDKLKEIGKTAGDDLRQFSWKRAAESFLELAQM